METNCNWEYIAHMPADVYEMVDELVELKIEELIQILVYLSESIA